MTGGALLIPFFAFALGTGMDFTMLLKGGLSGLLLGAMTTFICGFFMILADKMTGGSGIAGAAASSTAGNAVATPAAVALADPGFAAISAIATPQIVASTISTAIFTPALTAYIAKRNKRIKKHPDKENSRKTKEKIVVVADDFTGANDVGGQFCKKNLKTIITTNKDNINKILSDCDVLIIDTESRFDNKDNAYKKNYEIGLKLKKEKLQGVYKKLDSTFRGNIGGEISGLMDSMEYKHAVIVPAYPANHRTTRDGMVYVRGELLAETEVAIDPRTPVKDSFIPAIISQQTDKRIDTVNIDEILKGKDNLTQKLRHIMNTGTQIIVIDALNESDLDLVAQVTGPLKEQILFAGSSGFAEYLPGYMDLNIEKKINVVIAGSASEITRQQVDYAKDRLPLTLIDIQPAELFTDGFAREKNRIMSIVKESSAERKDIIIRSSGSAASVTRSFEEGRRCGLDHDNVCEIIACFLGEIAGDIIQQVKINGMLITGGDVAIKTAQRLNSSGTIVLDEILPGIPCGHFLEDQYKNVTIITKAGGFGNEDTIFRALNFLNNHKNG